MTTRDTLKILRNKIKELDGLESRLIDECAKSSIDGQIIASLESFIVLLLIKERSRIMEEICKTGIKK